MKKPYPKTLRVAVMYPFAALLLFTVAILAIVQQNSYERMLTHVSDRLLISSSDNIHNHLATFLEQPFNTTQILADGVSRHNLYNPPNLSSIEAYLKGAIRDIFHDQKQMQTLGFGSEDNLFIGLNKTEDQGLSLLLKDSRTENKLVIYDGDNTAAPIQLESAEYNPKTRPWYQPFAQSRQPGWSNIYTNHDNERALTISSVAPVFQKNEFLGVLVTDVNLSRISSFLEKESHDFSGFSYIADSKGMLIANSSRAPFLGENDSRIKAIDSVDPLIAINGEFLTKSLPSSDNISNNFQFEYEGERYFTRISSYYSNNLKWYIVITLPEKYLVGRLAEQQEIGLLAVLIVSICGLFMGLYAINFITKPIIDIAEASQNIDENNWEVIINNDINLYETTQLVQAFTSMSSRLKASFSSLRSQIIYDKLTGLFTRQGFIEHINQQDDLPEGTLALVGLRAFRNTHNSLGHQNAEELLIAVSVRLQERLSDHAIISRIEKDEFAIFTPKFSTHEAATDFAQSLVSFFNQPFELGDMEVIVLADVGVVCGSLENDGITKWLRNSSLALTQAVQQEEDAICHYQDDMIDASRKQTHLTAELKRAIGTNEFEVFYQPVIELATAEIAGAEALICWRSPTRGLVSPLDFIPLAEDTGMIIEIGQQVLSQACHDTQTQIEKGIWPKSFSLHVNMSVRELLQANYVEKVRKILLESDLPASNLALEVTESRLVTQPIITNKILQELRDLGIKIAIDDFGTGYSSLSYLTNLPFDSVKIDRSFVNEMLDNEKYEKMVATIINMAHSYNAYIVAEGIECAEQAEMLKSYGCRYAQGFYYSKPKPLEEW